MGRFSYSPAVKMQPYDKPHLTFVEQVRHLRDLGLDCEPESEALESLEDIGYYRLTAYTYPFRRLLRDDELRETEFQYRAPEYQAGASLSRAVALCRFDHGLRSKMFEGIAALELALRVQIAYVLGARDKFGHVNRDSLDAQACSQPAPGSVRDKYSDMFEYWVDEYEKLLSRAGGEDFIGHVRQKYSGEVPIWIAIETFDFGGLARLYSLLERYDQNLIASRFGVSQGRMFHNWLVGIAVIRNHCAHHNRLWNRQLPRALANIQPTTVTTQLHHLAEVDQRRKLYVWAAVLAYTLRTYDDTSNWYRTFTTQMKKFPADADLSPVQDMGFPDNWESNDLWRGTPATIRTLPIK